MIDFAGAPHFLEWHYGLPFSHSPNMLIVDDNFFFAFRGPTKQFDMNLNRHRSAR